MWSNSESNRYYPLVMADIATPPPFTVAQKKYIYIYIFSTLTKMTSQRFTSMLVALGGG